MIMVIHGGQTGVDRGGHEAALDNRWGIAGYMPRGARDECGAMPPDVARFLQPHESSNYAARTEANVRACDALLVVVEDAANPRCTPGTTKTIDLAAAYHRRRLVADPSHDMWEIAKWIHDLMVADATRPQGTLLLFEPHVAIAPIDPAPLKLMVAGPRESKWPGAQAATANLLRCVGAVLQHELASTRRTA